MHWPTILIESICFLGLIASSLFLYRNNWVFKQRTTLNKYWSDRAKACLERAKRSTGDYVEWRRAMDESNWWMDYYEEFADYDAMMWRFWIWNLEEFHYWPRPYPFADNVVQLNRRES